MTVGGGAGDDTALVTGGDVPDDQGAPHLTFNLLWRSEGRQPFRSYRG